LLGFWLFWQSVDTSKKIQKKKNSFKKKNYFQKKKKNKKQKKQKNKLVNFGGPPRKCAYQALIWML
jgi:hypothetical protein